MPKLAFLQCIQLCFGPVIEHVSYVAHTSVGNIALKELKESPEQRTAHVQLRLTQWVYGWKASDDNWSFSLETLKCNLKAEAKLRNLEAEPLRGQKCIT